MKSIHAEQGNVHLQPGSPMTHSGTMQTSLEHDVWDARSRLTATVIGLAAALTNFDVTSVVVVMPAIGRDFGIGVASWAWIIDAYSIAFTATLLVAGALTDRFGRRRSLLVGNVGFVAASLACGLAWNSTVFLAARGAQGAAAAFLVTGGFASIATAFPEPKMRARAFGLVGVVSGVAMALGPSLGGMIASGAGWRWIFMANLPVCVLIAIVVPRVVAEIRDGTDKPLDWPGVLILTLALGLAIEAILAARHSIAWMATGLAASAGLVAGFAVRQRRQLRPMLDPVIFASRSMAGIAALLLAVSVGYWAVLVYLPAFLGSKFGWNAEAGGLGLLIATLPMLVIPPFGGRLVPWLGWRRLFATALMLMAAGGGILIAAARIEAMDPALAWAFAGMALIGTGAALAHPQLSGAVVALASPAAAGMAAAVTVIARQAGFAMGVAALGALAPSDLAAAGFARPFGFAAVASLFGVLACRLLPPSSGGGDMR